MKKLNCRDLGFDCEKVIESENEEDIVMQAVEHAQTVHGLQEVPPEVVAAVKANIQEV